MIEGTEIKGFTVFETLWVSFVPGINLFIGDNGTGKTHLMKLLYALIQPDLKQTELGHKLLQTFKPQGSFERLIRKGQKNAHIVIFSGGGEISCHLSSEHGDVKISGGMEQGGDFKAVYIPVKEMLANAPGFRSLYSQRETHFEEIYADIIDKAFLPPLKKPESRLEPVMKPLLEAIGGKITTQNEVFYLTTGQGDIEFTLVAEGIRKLALLWLLIRNGALGGQSVLFWDEPEANVNPAMIPLIVEILYALSRIGTQVFIATHSYVICKEFDLQRRDHSLRYYALFRDESEAARLKAADSYHMLTPNRIADQFGRMYDLEVERSLGGVNG